MRIEEEKKQKKLAEQKKKLTPPEKLFIDYNDAEYTKFDDKGLPTHWMKEDKKAKKEKGQQAPKVE